MRMLRRSRGNAVYMGNAFTLDESVEGGEDGAVFATTCRLNHGCRPNTHRRWDAARGVLQVRACARIAAGDEITVSYIGEGEGVLGVPRATRRGYLLETLGFACECVRCRRGDAVDDRLHAEQQQRGRRGRVGADP